MIPALPVTIGGRGELDNYLDLPVLSFFSYLLPFYQTLTRKVLNSACWTISSHLDEHG